MPDYILRQLTSHCLRVTGFMWKWATSPKSWYMCSMRDTISFGSQCQMSNVGFFKYSSVSAVRMYLG